MEGGGTLSKFAAKLEVDLLSDAVESTEVAHERIVKMAEVSAILHLFGEDVAGVALVGNVEDVDGAVFYPFAGAVFSEFQMVNILHGGRVSPDDGGGVVVVNEGSLGVIEEWSSSYVEAIGEVADTDSNFGAFAGGKKIGFTGAKRYLFLAVGGWISKRCPPHAI